MKSVSFLLVAFAAASMCSCGEKKDKVIEAQYAKGTFGYDLDFIRQKDSVIVLNNNEGTGLVMVSAKYQAKVFTSSADGISGKSFGWINYKAFEAKEPDPHMNAYGGEDRLWLGPEGGKFSLFFKPGTKMEFDNWHTPPAIDNESWKLVSKSDKKASLSKLTKMTNYAGTELTIGLERSIEVLEKDSIVKLLGIELDNKVKAVAFHTTNTIINNGSKAWDRQTGAPCLWNLDMFAPSANTVIVVPYKENTTGKVATTDYFGQIPPDRVKYTNGTLFFKADGKSRGKLGMPPNRAKTMAGSYDVENNVLTVTLFDVKPNATYLNQEWKTDKDPFSGDAVNAYNDGPLADKTQMGPFYEIESVSPAAFLKPGAKLSHSNCVFHFTGDKAALNEIALKTLEMSLQQIKDAF